MNYWSDSNGFFDDNTINTPLYHLMTMFCKIMQRECFFFPSEKPVHGFVIPSVVNATAFDITQPLVLLVSIDCINPQGWSLLSLIPSLIYCHLLVLKQKWQRMNLMYFIFCAENQSAIEEIIVVNPILICWYFSIWNC